MTKAAERVQSDLIPQRRVHRPARPEQEHPDPPQRHRQPPQRLAAAKHDDAHEPVSRRKTGRPGHICVAVAKPTSLLWVGGGEEAARGTSGGCCWEAVGRVAWDGQDDKCFMTSVCSALVVHQQSEEETALQQG